MRKSILACTVSLLMSPMSSWALGMGDIQVNSSLNQPLNAKIELNSATKKDLDSLNIGLAPNSAFSRAGLERSHFLSKFRFNVIQKGGKNYVTITTRKPFREPFANFLIEASWGSGRLLREYTMLVDPPEFVKAQARPVTTAATSRSSQVKRTPKPATKKATPKVTAPDAGYAVPSLLEDGNGELSYGPTKRNDTLWSIAKKMAPANVSVDQMMLALLRDNPEAFVDNNINNLKSGYVLRIKDSNSLQQIDKSTAYRQAKEQYQTWKEARKQKTSTAHLVDRSDRSADDKSAEEGRLELVASGSSDAAKAQSDLASQAKQLKEELSMAGEELTSKEVENQELRERIKELEEMLKTKATLVELKDESLAALQKQKEVQSQQAAEMASESKMTAIETATEPLVEAVEETPVAEMVKEIPAEVTPEAAVAEMPVAETTDMSIMEHVDPSVELSKDDVTPSAEVAETPLEVKTEVVEPPVAKAVTEEIKPEEKAVEKPVAKPKDKKVKTPSKPPVAEESLVDKLTGEYLPYTAGGGAFLLALLAWLGLRGRGKKENDFEESILDSKMVTEESDFTVDDSELVESDTSKEVLASDTETSFLSDFSSDDMESLQPDDTEADPISEADVFMVYGRYLQAEELLKGAIQNEPDRLDYQMKLLEVYQGDNLKDSFAVQADVVRDLLKQNNDDYELTSEWTKAKTWAEKLDVDIDMPDSFEEGVPASDVEAGQSSTDDLSLESQEISFNEDALLTDLGDEDEFEQATETAEEDTSQLSLDDIELDSDIEQSLEADDEFNLNLDELDSDISEETFDLDESTVQLDSSEIKDSLELEETSEFDDSLSLELEDTSELEDSLELEEPTDSLELEEPTDSFELEEPTDSLELEEPTDSLELEDLEESTELDESLATEETLELEDSLESGDSLDLEDSSALEIDDTLATAEDELDLLDDDDMDFDDLEKDFPELDAVGTKLDLAKAYIDMGDMESASSILNEVIDEGDEEQKSQAQSLLGQTTS